MNEHVMGKRLVRFTFVIALGASALTAALACGEDLTVVPQEDASVADAQAGNDGATGEAGANDGNTSAMPPCELDQPFTEFDEVKFTSLPVVALDGLEDDRRPHLTPDELTIVFVSRREPSGGRKLYIADRQSRTLPFGKPSSVDVSFAADA